MSRTWYCKNCGKPVDDEEALLCLYCGEDIGRSPGVMGKLKYAAPGLVFAFVLVLIIAFLALMVF